MNLLLKGPVPLWEGVQAEQVQHFDEADFNGFMSCRTRASSTCENGSLAPTKAIQVLFMVMSDLRSRKLLRIPKTRVPSFDFSRSLPIRSLDFHRRSIMPVLRSMTSETSRQQCDTDCLGSTCRFQQDTQRRTGGHRATNSIRQDTSFRIMEAQRRLRSKAKSRLPK